jgi:large subunit ribosomal protein L20
MPRVKRGFKARRRRKKVLDRAEGFYGRRKSSFTIATEAVDHAHIYAFVGRKQRKRNFRRLWIQRINAAARRSGLVYSRLMHMLKDADIQIDRKMLAHLAVTDPPAFDRIVADAKNAV